MTDHLWAYVYGIKMAFGEQAKHLQVKKFTAKPNNNIIERMQSTIKRRTKVMRDLKTPETARIIIDGFLINYNYFRPHETLSASGVDTTPADKAQVKFPYHNWEEFVRHSQEAKQSPPAYFFKVPPPLPQYKYSERAKKQQYKRTYKRKQIARERQVRETLSSVSFMRNDRKRS